ncbi:tyrosine-protein phosphatase [Rhodococcus sp. WS4]|nr:tyrosine-protein phosphatase [Rhodococcus sp. WS4]
MHTAAGPPTAPGSSDPKRERKDTIINDQRIITLHGANNIRDLGDCSAPSGRHTRPQQLYRSEFFEVDGATTEPNPLRLRTVVDLRRTEEVEFERVAWESSYGVAYYNIPLSLPTGNSWTADYNQYLIADPDAVVKVIAILTDPDNYPALFHCAGGKDRTGVVAAILLALAGVDRNEIVQDYLLTEIGLPEVIARVSSKTLYEKSLQAIPYERHIPKQDKIEAFLDWLDSTWGGVENWLTVHGLPPEALTRYRDAILTD